MKTSRANKLAVVIDDNLLVLEATAGLLRSWGFRVIATETASEAMERLTGLGQRPDLIVCDYRLAKGARGTDVIEWLRGAFEIPALLISGDAAAPMAAAGVGNYSLLHKPLDAAKLRAALVDASVLQA